MWPSAENVREVLKNYERIREYNSFKVLAAFQKAGVEERHFAGSTGYGLTDAGKDKLNELFAEVFGAEEAIASPLIASGTHAICIALFGLLRPLDGMLTISGTPYDTLSSALGLNGSYAPGGLSDFAIKYNEVALRSDATFDLKKIMDRLYIDKSIRVIYIQRSKGYALRPAISLAEIRKAAELIKASYPDKYIVVDNCYGEFTETEEPTEAGADVIAGSLIKNPGGGIACTGGYIAGKKDAMKLIAARFTTPATGTEIGSYISGYRQFFQGLFLAPSVVYTSLKGAILFAEAYEKLGYQVCPGPGDLTRSDIPQVVALKNQNELIEFIRAVQSASPVDANALPVADHMPGYDDKIIMASGSFTQGSTIELSADAPIRPPYCAYFQGGLTAESIKLALMRSLKATGALRYKK